MRTFEVTLSYSDEVINPIHEFIGENEDMERDQLLHGTVTDDGRDTFLFYAEGDQDAYAEALENHSATQTYDITTIDDTSFYAYLEQETPEMDRTILAAFSRPGVLVIPPVDFEEGGKAQLTLVGDSSEVQNALAALPSGVETTVTHISEYEGGPPRMLSSLPERQREAITVGVDVGYYEVPRQGSAADVGRRMGCAPGTAAEHLQKAESRIIKAVVDEREE